MQVEISFLADAAQQSSDGKLYALGAGIDHIFAQTFPVVHPYMALVLKLKLEPAECDRKHSLEIQLWDPDGKRLGPHIEAEFTARRNKDEPTKPSFVSLVLNILGSHFPRAGDYAFHIIINSEDRRTLPLYLRTLPILEPGQQQQAEPGPT